MGEDPKLQASPRLYTRRGMILVTRAHPKKNIAPSRCYARLRFAMLLLSITRLQLHAQYLVHPQCLPNAQVKHDLFTSTRDGIGADISVQALDLGSLATSAV